MLLRNLLSFLWLLILETLEVCYNQNLAKAILVGPPSNNRFFLLLLCTLWKRGDCYFTASSASLLKADFQRNSHTNSNWIIVSNLAENCISLLFETSFSTRCAPYCCLLRLQAIKNCCHKRKIYDALLAFMSLLEATWTFRCVMVL